MSLNNPQQFTTFALPGSKNDSFDIIKLLKKYIFYWPFFILMTAIFIALAYFYIRITKPTYPINATLEFKTDKNTNGTVEKNALQELDPISKPLVFENEIEVMKSKKVMLQVVNEMKLWVTYVSSRKME